jgi:hypothetical protein
MMMLPVDFLYMLLVRCGARLSSVGRNVHVVRPLALALAEQMHRTVGRRKISKPSDLSWLQLMRLCSVFTYSHPGRCVSEMRLAGLISIYLPLHSCLYLEKSQGVAEIIDEV